MVLLRTGNVEEDVAEGLDRVHVPPHHQIREAHVVVQRDLARRHAAV
jgi:hypothetical protein